MKKNVKISILIASILSVVGFLVCAAGLFLMDFDFSKLNTQPIVTNTHEVTEDFAHISIQTNTADVVFAVSEDDNCHVVCNETEKLTHSVRVEGDTLVIQREDHRKWYDHIGISIGEYSVTVYLPRFEYANISIETDTGDVSVGNVNVTENVSIETDTGDVLLRAIEVGNKLTVVTDTGDVTLDRTDAASMAITTDTGDVTGTLLSEKIFFATSDTGKVQVPKSVNGGECEITTDTGDIIIIIAD